jgi:inosine/xanthosine triphosphatase
MEKIKVAVGTDSALKIRALRAALAALGYEAEVLFGKAESGVNMQPVGLDEMERGARNRAAYASKEHSEAQFYVCIENGLVQQSGRWYDPTCIVVLTSWGGEESVAFGAFFPVPTWIAEKAASDKTNTDIGIIVQGLAGGGEKDAMKYLSEGTVHREELLAEAIECAFTPIRFPNRYQE